jgi:hypothetical protein
VKQNIVLIDDEIGLQFKQHGVFYADKVIPSKKPMRTSTMMEESTNSTMTLTEDVESPLQAPHAMEDTGTHDELNTRRGKQR